MNLYINSPCYYTQQYGVIDEVYQLCKDISQRIDITKYTSCIDIVGITPIIAPKEEIKNGRWKAEKKIHLASRIAIISIHTDFDKFCSSSIDIKKQMIVENIIESMLVIKKRLKQNFDYETITADIIEILNHQ